MTQNNQHRDTGNPNPDNNTSRDSPPLYAVPTAPHSQSWIDRANEQQRVQVRQPEDLVAYIQSTLGFRPQNSLVAIAFADNQLSTVVRCDLPPTVHSMLRSDTPEGVTFLDFGLTEFQELHLIQIGRHLGNLLAKEPSTTSCIVVYFADEVTVSDQQALAVAGAANSLLCAQFGLQQVPVEQAWFIHHQLLWHLKCAATTDCEVQGEPMGNPEDTTIFAALDPQGTSSETSNSPVRELIFPPASTMTPRDAPDSHILLEYRPQVVVNWLKLWDDKLSNGLTMLTSDHVAQLLEALEYSEVRKAVMALASFDFTTAVQGMVTVGDFPEDVADAAQLQTHLADGVNVEDCIIGRSQRAPDWQRIGALEKLCRQLLPLSDAVSGGPVAGLLVWIEWVRGRGSLAMRYVNQARKRFPAEQFLMSLEKRLQHGMVAEWATRPETAWSPQHAA